MVPSRDIKNNTVMCVYEKAFISETVKDRQEVSTDLNSEYSRLHTVGY
jgi:hypothetical protein